MRCVSEMGQGMSKWEGFWCCSYIGPDLECEIGINVRVFVASGIRCVCECGGVDQNVADPSSEEVL